MTTDAPNAVLDAIMSRASVREYLPDPVPDEQVEALLKAGMAAPSACDVRPWAFVVVRERRKLDELGFGGAPCAVAVCADGRRLCGSVRFEIEGAWQQDCAAATENILLAAHSMGLGACWRICWPSPTVMGRVKAVLGLPFGVVPFSCVTVGKPREAVAAKDKYSKDAVHYEKW